jgi:hypothetical protein
MIDAKRLRRGITYLEIIELERQLLTADDKIFLENPQSD